MDIFRSLPYTSGEGEGEGVQPRAGMPIHGTGTPRRLRKKGHYSLIGTNYVCVVRRDNSDDFLLDRDFA